MKRSAAPNLLEMLPDRANIEVFLSYVDEMTGSDPKQIVEIWRGRRGGEAALVHSFALEAGGFSRVSFFQPPDSRDTPKVLIDVGGEAPEQSLAVYRYENKAFHLVAEKPLPPDRIAYVLEVRDGAGGKEIMVRSGSPPPCGKVSHEEDTVYRLRGDELLVPARE